MLLSEVSVRYAKALHELSSADGQQDKVFAELKAVSNLLKEDKGIDKFINSPLVKPSDKEDVLKKAVGSVSDMSKDFLLTLAKKNRLNILGEVVEAFQEKRDEANGVTRGVVTSSNVLAPEERQEIEKKVTEVTGKRVILTYEEDTELIGGLIAKVGSYTFDDTLTGHLKRLKDDLKRSVH